MKKNLKNQSKSGQATKSKFSFSEDGIIKIGDIYRDRLSKEAADVIESGETTYRDQVLKEHLYNLFEIEDEDRFEFCTSETKKEIRALVKAMQKSDVAYLRIID